MIDLKDKVIAVTGISKDESKYGFKVFKNLISKNLRIYGVNPNADVVWNRKIYKKISEILEKVDIVVTVVPLKITENIVDKCKNLWINGTCSILRGKSLVTVKKSRITSTLY